MTKRIDPVAAFLAAHKIVIVSPPNIVPYRFLVDGQSHSEGTFRYLCEVNGCDWLAVVTALQDAQGNGAK